ncbi:methionyl-tRNA formyltransferase [Anaeroselena agilis]|uniref:Methionyl-tRNA formyltransferase n=1 Tax=Anaeroselena agilis TaxID=3063788 RepID=A0ABU3NXH6_9FIRM|nr:methionyl-tRNA formyltransferase [Selenomonadales bacterium 4137-cl]
MSRLRVVFMGTPDFAVPCLDRLVADGHEVAAVVTQPDRPKGRGQKLTPSPVKEAALGHGLAVMQPEKIRAAEFQAQLAALAPAVIVVVAFGQFLPKAMLELPPLGCVNVHASLLPRYRGAAPIHWAVMNGESSTGVTTMLMDTGMDTGDMILKAEVAIGPNETTGEVHDRLKELGATVLSATLARLADGTAPRMPQDGAAASYAPLLTRAVERIDWGRPAAAVHNLVRGLSPWPGAYCLHAGRTLKVWRSEVVATERGSGRPGRVIAAGDAGAVVLAGDGAVRLTEVQPENRRRMGMDEYIRGYGLTVGETLE